MAFAFRGPWLVQRHNCEFNVLPHDIVLTGGLISKIIYHLCCLIALASESCFLSAAQVLILNPLHCENEERPMQRHNGYATLLPGFFAKRLLNSCGWLCGFTRHIQVNNSGSEVRVFSARWITQLTNLSYLSSLVHVPISQLVAKMCAVPFLNPQLVAMALIFALPLEYHLLHPTLICECAVPFFQVATYALAWPCVLAGYYPLAGPYALSCYSMLAGPCALSCYSILAGPYALAGCNVFEIHAIP